MLKAYYLFALIVGKGRCKICYMCIVVFALIANTIKQKKRPRYSVATNALKAEGRIGIATLAHPVIP